MSLESIEQQLKTIVIASLKIRESEYNEDLTAGDLPQWDSIGHVNLLMAVEQGFDIAFDVSDAVDIESVGDLQEKVRKYVAQKDGSTAAN